MDVPAARAILDPAASITLLADQRRWQSKASARDSRSVMVRIRSSASLSSDGWTKRGKKGLQNTCPSARSVIRRRASHKNTPSNTSSGLRRAEKRESIMAGLAVVEVIQSRTTDREDVSQPRLRVIHSLVAYRTAEALRNVSLKLLKHRRRKNRERAVPCSH